MTDLNKMWEALARYQPYADADGHGESWRVMCERRTEYAAYAAAMAAAWDATRAAADAAAGAKEAAWAVAWAERAAARAKEAEAERAAKAAAEAAAVAAYWSDLAIERINQAIKERNND